MDAYQKFFEEVVSKERFFEFGLKEIIFCDIEQSKEAWAGLKRRLKNNETVFIRSYGRKGVNSHLYQALYSHVFDNKNVEIDRTNNQNPRKVIERHTGLMKRPTGSATEIRNYQVAHVFGRTKNAFAFTAPWNIVYIPKLLDPFTGHEAKGESVKEFTALFQKKCYDYYQEMICDFNHLMVADELPERLAQSVEDVCKEFKLDEKQRILFSSSVGNEFSQIML